MRVIKFGDLPALGTTLLDLTATLWTSPKDGEALRLIEIGGVGIERE